MPGLRVVVMARWPEVRAFVVTALRDLGHRVAPFDPGDPPALAPDVVVRDAQYEVDHAWGGCPAVLMSGMWTPASRTEAEAGGAVCLAKPFTAAELAHAVARAARRA